MRHKKRIVIIVLCLMTVVAVVRQAQLKKEYAIEDLTVTMDGYMEYRGYKISVTEASIWDYDSYYEQRSAVYPNIPHHSVMQEIGVIEVKIRIDKTEENDYSLELGSFNLELGYHNREGIDIYSADEMNDHIIFFGMEKGNSREFTLPFILYSENYTKDNWENRTTQPFKLVWTIYPEKRAVILDPLQNYIDENRVQEIVTTEQFVVDDYFTALGDEAGKVYDAGSSVKVKDFRYEVLHAKNLSTLEEIYENTEDGFFFRDMQARFDSATGEKIEKDIMYIRYTVRITNESDSEKDFFLLMNSAKYCGDDPDAIFGENFYSDTYGNPENEGSIIFAPGETKEIEFMCNTSMNDWTGYDLYYVINPYGGRTNFLDDNITFIKIDLEE